MAHLTYTYDTGAISHYALKKVEGRCNVKEDRTTLIGVMCRFCEHYCGLAPGQKYVICAYHEKDDEGEDVREIRYKINERLTHDALCAFYD